MIDREHLELHPDERIPEMRYQVGPKRRGCLGFLLLAIAILAIAAPRAGQYVTPAVTLEETSRTPTDQLGAPPGRVSSAEQSTGLARRAGFDPQTRSGGVTQPAASTVTEPLSGYGSGTPVQSTPAPSASIGTALVAGVATWFDAPGLQAAVPWWQPGQDPVLVRVCSGDRCIVVTATGFCACGDRDGRPTIADLSRKAFARLAPLSQGVVEASMEWPIEPLPATDEEEPDAE